MKTVSAEDLLTIDYLKVAGVLESVQPDRVDLSGGVITVLCSDGSHFWDKIRDLARSFRRSSVNADRSVVGPLLRAARFVWVWLKAFVLFPMIHPLALNGGALCISPRWPTPEEAIVLKRHILQAMELRKGIVVLLYTHLMCGAASKFKLSITDVLNYLADAYQEVCNLGRSSNWFTQRPRAPTLGKTPYTPLVFHWAGLFFLY